jgi:hypothetical protein
MKRHSCAGVVLISWMRRSLCCAQFKFHLNNLARERRFTIHPIMCVPKRSIISRVFNKAVPYDEAEECLSWWEASNGSRLPQCVVRVKARRSSQCVEALVMPLG